MTATKKLTNAIRSIDKGLHYTREIKEKLCEVRAPLWIQNFTLEVC